MNISKVIALGGTIFLLLGSAFGCAKPAAPDSVEYNVYEIGSFESADGGQHTSEYPLWDPDMLNYHQAATVAKEASVTFNGQTYTGQYDLSSVQIPNTYVSHRYTVQYDDGKVIWFSINSATGELASIWFISKDLVIESATEAECRKIADELAKVYIPLSEYCVKTDEQEQSYIYTYYREVNGYPTSDQVHIAVKKNGTIASFGTFMLGAFEGVKSISIDENKASEAVEKKMDTIYASTVGDKSFEIKDKQLVKLENEKIAVLYTVDVEIVRDDIDQDGTKRQIQSGSLLQLILSIT